MVGSDAGAYNQRISICKNEPTTNTDGQRPANENVWIQRWASVNPLSGRERLIAQQTQADVTYRVRMRYDTQTKTIDPTMHLKLRDGTVLNITRAFDLEMAKTEIELECTRRV